MTKWPHKSPPFCSSSPRNFNAFWLSITLGVSLLQTVDSFPFQLAFCVTQAWGNHFKCIEIKSLYKNDELVRTEASDAILNMLTPAVSYLGTNNRRHYGSAWHETENLQGPTRHKQL